MTSRDVSPHARPAHARPTTLLSLRRSLPRTNPAAPTTLVEPCPVVSRPTKTTGCHSFRQVMACQASTTTLPLSAPVGPRPNACDLPHLYPSPLADFAALSMPSLVDWPYHAPAVSRLVDPSAQVTHRHALPYRPPHTCLTPRCPVRRALPTGQPFTGASHVLTTQHRLAPPIPVVPPRVRLVQPCDTMPCPGVPTGQCVARPHSPRRRVTPRAVPAVSVRRAYPIPVDPTRGWPTTRSYPGVAMATSQVPSLRPCSWRQTPRRSPEPGPGDTRRHAHPILADWPSLLRAYLANPTRRCVPSHAHTKPTAPPKPSPIRTVSTRHAVSLGATM